MNRVHISLLYDRFSLPSKCPGQHLCSVWFVSPTSVIRCILVLLLLFYCIPVNPQASAKRKVLQDMRKNRAVSSNGKSLNFVNLVTWTKPKVKEWNKRRRQVKYGYSSHNKLFWFKGLTYTLSHQTGAWPVKNRWKDMKAVMTPVATPRAKEPLKTPRKTPKDFNKAMASKLWLLSPAGW